MTIIKIHNIETGEVIEREMTSDELTDYESRIIAKEAEKEIAAEAAIAKSALLAKLGITEEEAKLLLS